MMKSKQKPYNSNPALGLYNRLKIKHCRINTSRGSGYNVHIALTFDDKVDRLLFAQGGGTCSALWSGSLSCNGEPPPL
jgi:hypothetical protein